MKAQRARSGAGRAMIGSGGGQLRGRGIGFVDVDGVAAEIVDVSEAIVWREGREVRVRGGLAVRIGAVRGVALGPDKLAQLSVSDAEAGRGAVSRRGAERGIPTAAVIRPDRPA